MAQIVTWKEAAHRVRIVDPDPAPTPDHPTPDRSPRINPEQEALQDRLEQVVRNENELLHHLKQCQYESLPTAIHQCPSSPSISEIIEGPAMSVV